MNGNGETTRAIRSARRWGEVVLTFVIFPLGLGLAGFALYLIAHRAMHKHEDPAPYWLMLTLLGLGLSPYLWVFRTQLFGLVDAGLKRAPIVSSLRKPKDGE